MHFMLGEAKIEKRGDEVREELFHGNEAEEAGIFTV
jgi:hypothetical protein